MGQFARLVMLSAAGRLGQPKRVIGSDYAEFSNWATGGIPVNFPATTTRIQLPRPGFLRKMPTLTEKFASPANTWSPDMAI